MTQMMEETMPAATSKVVPTSGSRMVCRVPTRQADQVLPVDDKAADDVLVAHHFLDLGCHILQVEGEASGLVDQHGK